MVNVPKRLGHVKHATNKFLLYTNRQLGIAIAIAIGGQTSSFRNGAVSGYSVSERKFNFVRHIKAPLVRTRAESSRFCDVA